MSPLEAQLQRSMRRSQNSFGLILPMLLIVLILVADILEGPKTAYVGVLACVAPLAAAFGTIRMVISVSTAALIGAFSIGYFASDGNVTAQNTRLVIISIASALAIAITARRIKTQKDMTNLASELAAANAINEQAHKDYLTGNLNRHGIVSLLNEFDHPVRSVVMIDLDNFKKINDVYGHKIGDEYIKAVTGRISSDLKAEDVFGRWGGDEFVAVLPHDEKHATEIFERVIAQATQTPFRVPEIEIPIKFSAGVAPWKPNATFETALQDADKALYEAKSRGGCAVVNFAELPDLGASSKNAH
jgi:diguanylate cyclase (GGDEF)-like protein